MRAWPHDGRWRESRCDGCDGSRRADVQQKASNELVGSECHHLGLVVVAVVLPAEADLTVGEPDQPAVGDGDAMSVAAEIGQHLLGTGEGSLGIDHPIDAAQGGQAAVKAAGSASVASAPEKHSFTCREFSLQLVEKQLAEQTGEHPHRQEEPGRQEIQRVRSGDRPPPGTTQ